MLAHISMLGDVTGVDGAWLGEPGSPHAMEALLLAPAAAGPPHLNPAPEYQMLYTSGLMTPWTPAGQPCGSRSYGLAAMGIRFRLSAETASFFDCRYDVAFTDGSRMDDIAETEFARAPQGAYVAALRLRITQRPATPLIVLNDLDTTQPLPWAPLGGLETPYLRLSLLSPAFATTPPAIRNGALIPAEPWDAMNVSFRRRVFPGRTVTLREIEDATIVSPGLVFDRDLHHVPTADQRPTTEEIATARAAAEAARRAGDSGPGAAQYISGLSVFCRTLAPANYGHLLVEALSRAWLAGKVLAWRQPTYILQATPLASLFQEALRAIGVEAVPAVLNGPPIRSEALVMVDGLTEHGVYQSPLCLEALRSMATAVPAAPPQKLFISRRATKRPLLNEEAIEATLRERGFVVVDPGTMPLTAQIALFKGASLVVGPLGAALSNIAFCSPGTRVVALTSQSFPDTFFWFLAQHGGLSYEEVRGKDAIEAPIAEMPWDAGFTLPEADLAYLAAL
jgi:capsular polysaccharide biosynthesis protein